MLLVLVPKTKDFFFFQNSRTHVENLSYSQVLVTPSWNRSSWAWRRFYNHVRYTTLHDQGVTYHVTVSPNPDGRTSVSDSRCSSVP